MTPWLDPWPFWLLLAGLGALLALDDTSVGQTWFSQPLPAAILAGGLAGDPLAGLLPGLLAQLVVVGNLPVGSSFRLDASSATLGVVVGAALGGWQPPGAPLARTAWVGPGAADLGGLVVAIALASILGGWLVHLERRARLGWMLDGYRSVRDGEVRRLERLQTRCLLVTALRGAALTLGWTVLVWRLWPSRAAGWSAPAGEVLALVPWFVPALAVGSLLERFGPRHLLPWVAVGVVGGLGLAWWRLGGGG